MKFSRPDGWKLQLYYSLPCFSTLLLFIPTTGILQGIYAKHYGMPLATIAAIVLFSRISDAFTDPLVGFYSDKLRASSGTRKHLVVIGGVTLLISAYFLFNPPNNVSPEYFLFWYVTFYFSWTLFEIPHLAWGGELASGPQEKTKIYMYRYIFGYAGTLCFYIIPFLPFIEGDGLGPEALRWGVVLAGLLLIPSLWLCGKKVHNGPQNFEASPKKTSLKIISMYVIKDKNLQRFLCAYLLAGAGAGMWVGMLYLFVDAYLLAGSELPFLYIGGTLAGIVAMLFWYKVSVFMGKRRALMAGLISVSACTFIFSYLQPESSYLFLFSIIMSVYFCYSSLQVLAPSVLSDIADENRERSKVDQSAMYFSLYSLATKLNFAVGGASALLIADLYGFNPSANVFSDSNIFGLKLSSSFIPSLLLLVSTSFIMSISFDKDKLAGIKAQAKR